MVISTEVPLRQKHPMSASILIQDELEIPAGFDTLDEFRHWTESDEFPDTGRIDFIQGRVEIDMSPDNLFFHSAPKSEIGRVIGNRLKSTNLGQVFVDKSRISVPHAQLSVEPDIVFVSDASIISGRVQLVPTAGGQSGSYIEFEGPPDLVVEVVSDSSRTKDTQRLFAAYFEAGVSEYWLVDARSTELRFQIHIRGTDSFVPVAINAAGYQLSPALGATYRLDRSTRPTGHWDYELREAAIA